MTRNRGLFSRIAPVEARLLTPISSYTAKRGDEIAAVITTPVCPGNKDALARGAILHGEVTGVHRVGLGLIYETARLRIAFDTLLLPGGGSYAVKSHLTAIDNARERVDSKGAIHGIRATATLSNRAGERLAFLAMGHPLGASGELHAALLDLLV